ncbi:MAG: hypothetical protein ABSG83_18135, partial [Roseiarcus sp.]
MTGRAAAERPGGQIDADGPGRAGPTLAALAAVFLVAALVPPLSSEARRLEVFEALQFALLAIVVPAL